jgi:hypothetical protein
MSDLEKLNIIIKFKELKKEWLSDKCDYENLTEEKRALNKLANDKLNEIEIKQINLLNHLLTSINENLVLFEYYKNKFNS